VLRMRSTNANRLHFCFGNHFLHIGESADVILLGKRVCFLGSSCANGDELGFRQTLKRGGVQVRAGTTPLGGGATRERVTTAFKLILSDPHVEGILVNIFGGIMRCDVIAEGVVAAAKEISLGVPLVVRLEGTNVELGKKILRESGLPIVSADNLADAAEKIVKAVKEAA